MKYTVHRSCYFTKELLIFQVVQTHIIPTEQDLDQDVLQVKPY